MKWKTCQYLGGQTFGKLTVISHAGKRCGNSRWNCVCECGRHIVVYSTNLTRGLSTSCGKSICHSHYKRGYAGGAARRTTEYVIWDNMKRRCSNPSASGWNHYGALGIQVCDRWHDFDNFLADMGARPSEKHSLDRINTYGNYEPTNCRWATKRQQQRNMKNNIWLEIDGERMILKDWSNRLGVSYQCIQDRLRRGWNLKRALTTPSLRPASFRPS